jgi:hypothetical protein
MRRLVKLIKSAMDVGPASFFASGDQIPLGREKHGDRDNPANHDLSDYYYLVESLLSENLQVSSLEKLPVHEPPFLYSPPGR